MVRFIVFVSMVLLAISNTTVFSMWAYETDMDIKIFILRTLKRNKKSSKIAYGLFLLVHAPAIIIMSMLLLVKNMFEKMYNSIQ